MKDRIVNCPDCHTLVVITKQGKIPRHGNRGFHSNVRGKDYVKTKLACTGSYKRVISV